MKKMTAPRLSVVRFSSEDVIAASCTSFLDGFSEKSFIALSGKKSEGGWIPVEESGNTLDGVQMPAWSYFLQPGSWYHIKDTGDFFVKDWLTCTDESHHIS